MITCRRTGHLHNRVAPAVCFTNEVHSCAVIAMKSHAPRSCSCVSFTSWCSLGEVQMSRRRLFSSLAYSLAPSSFFLNHSCIRSYVHHFLLVVLGHTAHVIGCLDAWCLASQEEADQAVLDPVILQVRQGWRVKWRESCFFLPACCRNACTSTLRVPPLPRSLISFPPSGQRAAYHRSLVAYFVWSQCSYFWQVCQPETALMRSVGPLLHFDVAFSLPPIETAHAPFAHPLLFCWRCCHCWSGLVVDSVAARRSDAAQDLRVCSPNGDSPGRLAKQNRQALASPRRETAPAGTRAGGTAHPTSFDAQRLALVHGK